MENLIFEQYYQKYGIDFQRLYPNEALINFIIKTERILKIAKDQRKEINVLELGCGRGANLWMIAKEGFNTFGIDIAPTGIKLCKQVLNNWGISADVNVGNMKKLDFSDNFFNIICDISSMQHLNLTEHIQSYKEAYRCLNPGGIFFQYHLSANSTSFKRSNGKLIDKITVNNIYNKNVPLNNLGITSFLTISDAKMILESIIGFKNIKIETYNYSHQNMTQFVEYLVITAVK